MTKQVPTRNRKTLILLSLLSGAAASLLVTLLASTFGLGPQQGGRDSISRVGLFDLAELEAQLGEGGPGDYIFRPNRRNMWVINKRTGRIIHYKFIDVTKGTIERSYPGQIDQTIFPPADTLFLISERNIADYLWVGNQRTGDFQLWRRNVRDGRLITDRDVVEPSRQLLSPAATAPPSNAPSSR